ncbi:MAG: MASE1 domain-containing protein, partial [Thiohalobacterales bacterium]|nr:MASE1 domain-containing protein [Thiohalobacterales bacterium]
MDTRTQPAPLSLAQRPLPFILALLATAVLYTAGAELGLSLALVHDNVTAVWPPSGIALAALLILGMRLWPAITIGAFTVNFLADLPLLPAIGIAMGNTLAAVIGALLVERLVRVNPLDSLRGVLVLVAGGGLFATTVSATIGTTTLMDAGLASRPELQTIWLTWWLGDSGGVLLVTPLLLAWRQLPRVNATVLYALEAVALLLCTLLVAQLVFGRSSPLAINHYPLAFLPLTTLVWSAVRFGSHGVTACLVLIATSAVWGTIGGSGPFVRENINESLLLLQAFMGVTTVAALLLGASLREREHAQQLLDRHHRERASSLGDILEASLNEIFMFDADTLRFINVNEGARKNLGYTMEELRQLTPVDIKPEITHEMFSQMVEPLVSGETNRIVFETMHQRKDGSRYPAEVNLQLSRSGDGQVFVAIILDITERHATRQQLDHMAHHDPLTDLPNRVLFSDRLTHALQHCARTRHPLALMFLDLDGFKKINDSLGHPAGDGLLKQVAHRLQLGARESDTVARLGGDEFTIILEDLDSLDNVPEVAERILDSLTRPFDVLGREVFL